MFQSLLKQFDLSEKEIQVYLTLIKHGTQSTSIVAKRAQLNRGTTFLALKELVKKGLASRMQKNNVQHHSAVSPRYLNSLLERKRGDLIDLSAQLKTAIPLLESMQNPLSPTPTIRFFEGKEGLRTLLEDTITQEGNELFGILSMQDLYDVFGERYFENYIRRRIKKDIHLHVMRNKTCDSKNRWKTSQKELRRVHYLPEKMIFPSTMYLYDNKVAFISSEKEAFGLLIESREIFAIQKNLFDTLWSSCAAPQ